MAGAPLVVVSNRGPRSFRFDDSGTPVATGSGGGLAGALRGVLAGAGATWVSCAMSEADRVAGAKGLMADGDVDVRLVEPSSDVYRLSYDVVSNATLWFVHHHLFDVSRRPRFDRAWGEAWAAYGQYNELFADAVDEAAAPGATVLVQDYHLCLLPAALRRRRPDLRTVHFSHTPFADPGVLRILPDTVGPALLAGMAAAGACGFHSGRWAQAFRACCDDTGTGPPTTFVSPLPADTEHLLSRTSSAAFTEAAAALDDIAGDCRVIVRVDRLEPTKNLLRGFWAVDDLLERRAELRGNVVMFAFAYASRQTLPEYLAYAAEVQHVVDRVNARWATGSWQPIVLDVADDSARSLAALSRYDVLLVNPVRDGLNLVAKEGPVVNTRDGVLVLSREAGVAAELAGPAVEINPFDVAATADALGWALDMDGDERRTRLAALRERITARTPRQWLEELMSAAG